MRRRTLVATAAAALATPLLSGCARDEGGDGGGDAEGAADGDSEGEDGGGNRKTGGPYGMIGTGGNLATDGRAGESGSRSDSRSHGGPALGPEP